MLVKILNNFNLDKDKILNIYPYGSFIYKTNTDKSDEDFIVIYNQEENIKDSIYSSDKKINITLISSLHFQEMINNHRIDSLECIFLPDDLKYEKIKFDFNYNSDILRRSISAVCSNSWVKCRKKFIDNQEYIGKKSLFHSLRIVDFGLQIADNKRIINYIKPEYMNYDSFMELWLEIDKHDSWKSLKEDYQELANNLRSQFRIVAPLRDINENR